MICQPSRKLKIALCIAFAALSALGAVVASQSVNRNDNSEMTPGAEPEQVRDVSDIPADSSLTMPNPYESSMPVDESKAVQARIENLKKKLRADHTDFGRMKRDLEDRLGKAPDGKISPDEVLAVIPPQHREEFKSVMAGMYAPSNKPTTIQETRP